MHPILEELGFKTLPGPEDQLLKKILSDNLVGLRSQEIMIQQFALYAVRQMNPLERAALVKRIHPPVENNVRWSVGPGLHSLRAVLSMRWRSEEVFFDGKPDAAAKIVFHGESPSPAILAQYRKLYDPTNVPTLGDAYYLKMYTKDGDPIPDSPKW